MYLTEKYNLPSFSPFRTVAKRSVPNNLDLICRSFDENVLRRLKTLTSTSNSPSISLSWLSLAVDFLSSTHDEAQTVISNLRSSCATHDDSLALYLNHSVKLLDVCNSISSEIERLRQRRLLINFVLHLFKNPGGHGIQVPATDKLRRAGDSLSDWEKNLPSNRRGFQIQDPEALVRDLASAIGAAPRGKVSSAGQVIQRTIYAVGLVTVFVAGVSVSALYGRPDVSKVRVPAEFLWADEFNGLQSASFGELKRRFFEGERKGLLAEPDEVATCAKRLRGVIDGGEADKRERLETAVNELEKATAAFSEGVDSLTNGVNGFFHKVLTTRTGVLDNYRVGNEKQSK